MGRYLVHYGGFRLSAGDNTRALLSIEARAGGKVTAQIPPRGAVATG